MKVCKVFIVVQLIFVAFVVSAHAGISEDVLSEAKKMGFNGVLAEFKGEAYGVPLTLNGDAANELLCYQLSKDGVDENLIKIRFKEIRIPSGYLDGETSSTGRWATGYFPSIRSFIFMPSAVIGTHGDKQIIIKSSLNDTRYIIAEMDASVSRLFYCF